MNKWYEENVNGSCVLSSRVRLARNYNGKLFPGCASDAQRIEIIEETARALTNYHGADPLNMLRIDMLDISGKYSLIDKHLISPALASEKRPSSVFISETDRLSVMVMEEDHVRIQALEAGMDAETAYENACMLDDILEDAAEYAFDETWGYLTSCPTNAGTGMRASFMLHIPYLEANGQIGNIARSISKFGFTLRGTFGEGTEACGSVYQISNQATLGLTEEEIINNLKSLTSEIVEKERDLARKDLRAKKLAAQDKVWRTYGILTNARRITEKEAINSLSVLKLGVMGEIIDKPLPNIYNLIINIRTATLAKTHGLSDADEISAKRAEYLRNALTNE